MSYSLLPADLPLMQTKVAPAHQCAHEVCSLQGEGTQGHCAPQPALQPEEVLPESTSRVRVTGTSHLGTTAKHHLGTTGGPLLQRHLPC